jgi:hypothetical protein
VLIDTQKGQKEVQIGGGVIIAIPETLWRVNAEVIEVIEGFLKIKGADFDGWVPQEWVKDVLSPGTFALDHAINVLGGEKDEC